MKQLNLQRVPGHKYSKHGNNAYIKDFTEDMIGHYIFIKREWKYPAIGIINDSYTYEELQDRKVYSGKVTRYFYDYFKVYLIDERERRVLMI